MSTPQALVSVTVSDHTIVHSWVVVGKEKGARIIIIIIIIPEPIFCVPYCHTEVGVAFAAVFTRCHSSCRPRYLG